MATYVFDSGEWDHEEVVGPASKAPANIRALRTTLLRVEWLDLSRPSEKQYSKNHMVFTAVLETPIVIGIKRCFAARLSMEVDYNVGPDDKVPGVEKILICGDDYAPGTYTLALLGYDTPTNIACHHRSYNLKEGMTLGGLIDPIISREMHKFVFLIYTNEKNRFKGCGHHLIRVFTVYIDLGIIPDENSLENPNKSLAEELVSTYVRDRGIKTTHARVGRGRFLEWDDAEHRLVDDDMWSYAPPLHQQRLANAGQV